MKIRPLSYVFSALLLFANPLTSQWVIGTPAYAGEYFPGRVVFSFKAEYMPNQTGVDLQNCRFSIPQLDSIVASRQGTRLRKFRPGYSDQYPSEAAGILGRTFILEYEDGTDPAAFVSELSALPYFQLVDVNPKIKAVFSGTQRFEPGDGHFFSQWYLDSNDDDEDIDAPEAWAIERGDPNLIIGIADSGTMVDTFHTPWELHPDFNYFFNDIEDFNPTLALTFADIDAFDDTPGPGTDPDDKPDNVIGTNYRDTPSNATDPDKIAFWESQPINAVLAPTRFDPWKFDRYFTHGLNVASIAAAKAGPGNTTVGVANQCKVYHTRINDDDPIKDAEALDHAALYSPVINMSFAYDAYPGLIFEMTTQTIAEIDDVVLVAIVGNISQIGQDVGWPGRFDWVLGVGNMTRAASTPSLDRYFDSSFGPTVGFVSVVAPVDGGVPTNSHNPTLCGGAPGPCDQTPEVKSSFGGTSAASPQAAGIAALIRSRYPGLNQQQVRDRIVNSAEVYWDPTDPQKQMELGAGKVNAYRALTEWGSIKSGETVTWSSKADEVAGDLYSKDDIFYVSGDLTIEDGGTLTINKGLEIRVAPDHLQTGDPLRVEIVVEFGGTLNIMGEVGTEIVFKSFTDSPPAVDDWIGIKLEAGSTSILKNVVIKNAAIGVAAYAPLTLEGLTIEDGIEGIETHADVLVKNSVINNLTNTGIDVHSGTVTVENDTISNCAIGIDLSIVGSASAIVRDSYIHDITYSGVSSLFSDHSVTLERTRIENAFDGVRLVFGTNAVIDACLIKNNDTGISITADSAPLIKRCVIDSNTTNGIYCVSGSNVTIDADTITNNSIGVYCLTNSNPTIQNGSWIKGNTAGIKADDFSNPVVRSSKITGNVNGVAVINDAEPDLGRVNGPNCSGPDQGLNSIHHNTPYDVANLTTTTIEAECNFWTPTGPDPTKFVGPVDADPYLSTNPLPVSGWVPDEDEPEEREASSLPASYGLSYNYPNPFNPVTTVKYEVPPPGGVIKVAIYNVGGQVIKTILNGHQPPGFYTITWDGKSDEGVPVASGVYFVQMRAKGFRETKKLVLLK